MPIGKVWIYRLLFVCFCVCVCTVMDFSAKDKVSGIKFCTVVYWLLGRESPILGTFAPPETQNLANRSLA